MSQNTHWHARIEHETRAILAYVHVFLRVILACQRGYDSCKVQKHAAYSDTSGHCLVVPTDRCCSVLCCASAAASCWLAITAHKGVSSVDTLCRVLFLPRADICCSVLCQRCCVLLAHHNDVPSADISCSVLCLPCCYWQALYSDMPHPYIHCSVLLLPSHVALSYPKLACCCCKCSCAGNSWFSNIINCNRKRP